ncbi:hypothetical protein HMPREF9622_01596 [Cutibacterium modestum HL037PA3]|uniref:Uncharacterized protein n=1 Tax=Cutibacterium modestum HL044PA1 TaxID=765109 RepID=A0ABN0C669_9ACTN|nr:hypothetical protein HMPREF9621_01619 [Cutibacterium modestum HL037PA2]EFS92662.1 hypothetical protein HMPREF9607_01193 [Cutibacterium modestum HL044PA1]EFT15390.1 hypothetical protein HMPREF9622_01596 [Cutibacterium modestum HL037PA3]EGG26193.1 hypothetical protein PA08_2158 [Cutibacterium modestum P08]
MRLIKADDAFRTRMSRNIVVLASGGDVNKLCVTWFALCG